MQVGPDGGVIARTRVYVDGFNLYHGRLRRTPFKWLDPIALVEQVLKTVTLRDDAGKAITAHLLPQAMVYFTAVILDRAASSPESVPSQLNYHNALTKAHGDRLEIAKGYYSLEQVRAHQVVPKEPGKLSRIKDAPKVEVWRLVEKQSDVKLALRIFHDALKGDVDHVVVVTNDTDIAPALEMIRQHTQVKVGVIVPTADGERRANTSLVQHAHWHRRHLTDEELLGAQLPPVLYGGNKPTRKPISWYSHPQIVQSAFDICLEDLRTAGKVWAWLHSPNAAYFEGQAPIAFCASEEGLLRIKAYAEAWRRSRD